MERTLIAINLPNLLTIGLMSSAFLFVLAVIIQFFMHGRHMFPMGAQVDHTGIATATAQVPAMTGIGDGSSIPMAA